MADAETVKTPEEKIAFIQSMPFDMGAGEVIQKGKDAGIDFSRSYVYTARRLARESAPKASEAPRKEKGAAATSKTTKASPRKRRLERGDKAAFVRTMPNASPPDIVKAALEQGIPLTLQTVYTTRGGDAKKKKGARAASKAKNSNGASKALARLQPETLATLDKAREFVGGKGQFGSAPAASELGAACIALLEAASTLGPVSEELKRARVGILDAVLTLGLIRPDQIISAIRANMGNVAAKRTQHN